MHRTVFLIFICALFVTTISFLVWLPHFELFGSDGGWGLLIAIFVPGFFVTFFSGLMLISLVVQAVFRRLHTGHRGSSSG